MEGFAQQLVDRLAERGGVPFAVLLANGTKLQAGAGAPAFTVRVYGDAALAATITRGHLGLQEA
jgi:hypothetical protein